MHTSRIASTGCTTQKTVTLHTHIATPQQSPPVQVIRTGVPSCRHGTQELMSARDSHMLPRSIAHTPPASHCLTTERLPPICMPSDQCTWVPLRIPCEVTRHSAERTVGHAHACHSHVSDAIRLMLTSHIAMVHGSMVVLSVNPHRVVVYPRARSISCGWTRRVKDTL